MNWSGATLPRRSEREKPIGYSSLLLLAVLFLIVCAGLIVSLLVLQAIWRFLFDR